MYDGYLIHNGFAAAGLGNYAQVRFNCFPSVGELLLRFFVRYRRNNDHVIAVFPVHGSGYLVFGGQLDGVEHAQHFIEVTAGGHVATQPASESSLLGRMGPDGSMHEHGVLTNSNHPESIRESAPNAQLRDPTWPWTEDASARLVESAMRGDLRVGVHTEAFGRVTIQTNAQGGQLSAQLSLENPKESAALAAHLPGVEQKIVQEHGLNASVRLVGGSDGSTGAGSMGRDHSGGGPERERYRNDVATRPRDIEHDFSNESRGVEAAFIGTRYLGSSRLDVTV